jgi:hypothetical protein
VIWALNAPVMLADRLSDLVVAVIRKLSSAARIPDKLAKGASPTRDNEPEISRCGSTTNCQTSAGQSPAGGVGMEYNCPIMICDTEQAASSVAVAQIAATGHESRRRIRAERMSVMLFECGFAQSSEKPGSGGQPGEASAIALKRVPI